MLRKRVDRSRPVEADYVGFDIPNEFVVGYGLDFNERYRNLPFIGVLTEEAIRPRRPHAGGGGGFTNSRTKARQTKTNPALSQRTIRKPC